MVANARLTVKFLMIAAVWISAPAWAAATVNIHDPSLSSSQVVSTDVNDEGTLRSRLTVDRDFNAQIFEKAVAACFDLWPAPQGDPSMEIRPISGCSSSSTPPLKPYIALLAGNAASATCSYPPRCGVHAAIIQVNGVWGGNIRVTRHEGAQSFVSTVPFTLAPISMIYLDILVDANSPSYDIEVAILGTGATVIDSKTIHVDTAVPVTPYHLLDAVAHLTQDGWHMIATAQAGAPGCFFVPGDPARNVDFEAGAVFMLGAGTNQPVEIAMGPACGIATTLRTFYVA